MYEDFQNKGVTRMNKKQEQKILSKLLVDKFEFKLANGWFTGYGKTVREAARNLDAKGKTMEIGMLVQVYHNKQSSWWDGREFVKELKKGDKIRSKTTKEADGQ